MLDLNALKPNIYANPANMVPWRNVIAQCEYPQADRVRFAASFPIFDDYLITITSGNVGLDCEYVVPGGGSISDDRSVNFALADHWVVGRLGGTMQQLRELRSQRCLTWHEKEDTRTMVLVPRAIHGFVHHSGGIQVVINHGIGVKREDRYPMEPRDIRGEALYRVMDLDIWRRAREPQGYGAGQELTVSYICADPDAGPTPAQQARARELLTDWSALSEKAREQLRQYVDKEWSQEDWTARPKELIIYPEESWKRMTAGILWDFDLDREHGLGVRVLGDGTLEAGDGDIVL